MQFETALNSEQWDAVRNTEGPVLVLAGAGSGKTRVLMYKIAYLVDQGLASPPEILAVTFTNKAAGEMKARIAKLIPGTWFPYVGTFHSFCARLLRTSGGGIIDPQFVIYDDSDRKAVLKECLRELSVDEKITTPEKTGHLISKLKNDLVTPQAYASRAISFDARLACQLYELYEKKMRSYCALDFDDLIMKSVELLRADEALRDEYRKKFRYILVDEYQDINYAQYMLVLELCAFYRNITVVGDDDQSIYRFRGADMSILLRFEEDFPEAVMVKLEQNYRSTRTILEAANHLMTYNKTRKEKKLWTESGEGTPILFHRASDGRAEARFVLSKIRELMKSNSYRYKDFVIIYRTNAQSRLFEEVFIQEGIPYNLVGSLKFYERKEIKDLLAYLRLVVNINDNISFKRIINVPPRGIGDVTLKKIEDKARERAVSLFEGAHLIATEGEGSSKSREALKRFVEVMLEATAKAASEPASALVDFIISETLYRSFLLQAGKAEGIAREENINEFINVVKEFESISEKGSLADFLSQVSLTSDIDMWNEEEGKVNLMTFHLTKGLEFPVVFITGLEEKLVPHVMSLNDRKDLEEERRLCYVGITRARERLFLSHAQVRLNRGLSEDRIPSRFLKELPSHVILAAEKEYPAPGEAAFADIHRSRLRARARAEALSDSPADDATPLEKGDAVKHEVFGTGRVLEVKRDVIRVDFIGRGIKSIVRPFLKKIADDAPIGGNTSVGKGDRVVHAVWGKGVVCSREQSGGVLVIFPSVGSKLVRTAELSRMPQNVTEGGKP
ncbi:MAG: 3'-5' exonuclease [Candidatus Eremiobacteraeota bacterium]|nr:3'-5' exonuclease [Candidatus Eremiobacteraeota bacterium]